MGTKWLQAIPKWFLLVFVGSFLFNILFVCIDLGPSVIRRIHEPEYLEGISENEVEKLLVEASYGMFTSEKMHMPMSEPSNMVRKVNALFIDRKTRIYYYPRAYLALGLTTYGLAKDTVLLGKVADQFDKYYIGDNKGPKFNFELVDQTPIGLAALKLYHFSGEIRYKKIADEIFEKLKSMVVEKDGFSIILYRPHHSDLFVDVLGMVCPFLIEYGVIFNNREATDLAFSQLRFFMEYGLDIDNRLPFHGVSLDELEGLGPNNWGRGMGWYMLALEAVTKNADSTINSQYGFKKEAKRFISSCNDLKFEDTYTQFPGTSEDFDSSASTMLMYGENSLLPGRYSRKEILRTFRKHIKSSGVLDGCSGDAYGINKYSLNFGESELSQGMLLLLLSSATS